MLNAHFFGRSLATALTAMALTACGGGEIELQWTIEGEEASADACTNVAGDTLNIKAVGPVSSDGTAGEVVETTADCADGQATVALPAGDTSLVVELLRGDIVAGLGGPYDIADNGDINPLSEAKTFLSDIEMLTGRFTAEFVVVDAPICDFGPSGIDVSFRAVDQGVESTEVATGTVSCSDDRALFTYDDAQIGKAYLVSATTTIDGKTYRTPNDGARFMMDRPVLNLDVGLNIFE